MPWTRVEQSIIRAARQRVTRGNGTEIGDRPLFHLGRARRKSVKRGLSPISLPYFAAPHTPPDRGPSGEPPGPGPEGGAGPAPAEPGPSRPNPRPAPDKIEPWDSPAECMKACSLERLDYTWRHLAMVDGGMFLGLQALEAAGVISAGAGAAVGIPAAAAGFALAGGYAFGSALSCAAECAFR